MDLDRSTVQKRGCLEDLRLKSLKVLRQDKNFKENCCPKDTTHLYMDESSEEVDMPSSILNSVKKTPKKCFRAREEPITPTSNIKLLTSLAAKCPYVTCKAEKSKLKKRSSKEKDIKPSRKEKSLSLVCTKFLDIFPMYPDPETQIFVPLDEVGQKLKVERRRLYDIVNVFESVDMLKKNGKNQYSWYGKNNLVDCLKLIRAAAFEENVNEKLEYVLMTEGGDDNKLSCILDEVQEFNKNLQFEEEPVIKKLRMSSPFLDIRKEKSLALLSQKFLMLFLVSPEKTINLSAAAKVLNGFHQNDQGAQTKTQIRRLYDIANVLCSIGLVQKAITHKPRGKKPAYRYTGPDLGSFPKKTNAQIKGLKLPTKKNINPRSLLRHSSFQEICAVAEMEHQKLFVDSDETSKSVPPFEKSTIQPIDSKISFTDFTVDSKIPQCAEMEHQKLCVDSDETPKSVPYEKSIVKPINNKYTECVEMEHQKLDTDSDKTPNSSLPFEKGIEPIKNKISYTDFACNAKIPQYRSSVLMSEYNFKPIYANSELQVKNNVLKKSPKSKSISNTNVKRNQVQKIQLIPVQPLMSKSGSNNRSFYIINKVQNNEIIPTNSETLFVFNDQSKVNQSKEEIKSTLPDSKEEIKSTLPDDEITSKTIQLSPAQRDAILKSLNISLSEGQVAAIQLAGSTSPFDSSSNSQCNILKIIERRKVPHSEELQQTDKQINISSLQNCNLSNTESNGSANVCSTRNSPSSNLVGYDSPISIPSGYATPILCASSEITSFPSNSEVDYILKKIENGTDTLDSAEICRLNSVAKVTSFPKFAQDIEMKDERNKHSLFRNSVAKVTSFPKFAQDIEMKDEQNKHSFTNNIHKTESQQILDHLSDNCSSESLNAEVSSLFKENSLDGTVSTVRSRSFLIDEKTILSPIKKSDKVAKLLTPSPLMTPPYINSSGVFPFIPPRKYLGKVIINHKNIASVKIKNGQSNSKKLPYTR